MVGIILKNFFISSQQTIQLPPSNAHRLCAPNVANEKKSVLFRRIPNADCHIYHRLDNSVFLPSSLQLGGSSQFRI